MTIRAGSRLFCTARPDQSPGDLIRPGEFGRRVLESVSFRRATIHGRPAVQKHFEALGATLPDDFDYERPRKVEVMDAQAGHALKEMLLEVVRLREFPSRPSRLECMFLWESERTARDFHSRRPWPTGLYEVEVIECSGFFRADMNIVSWISDPETIASLMDRARRYWSSSDATDPEVLLQGSVKVTKRLH